LEYKDIIDQCVACEECDGFAIKPTLSEGQIAKCNQCGATLFDRKVDPINRTLAISLAGLIVLFPAIFLPVIGVDTLGVFNEVSLISSIVMMIEEGSYLVAVCVFVFAIAVPVVRLFSAFYLSLCLKVNYIKPSLLVFFRSYHQLDSWAMLHIFLLGIIVSMYKLVEMTNMTVGLGMYALVFLLLCSTLISITLDQDLIWGSLESVVDQKNS